MQLFEEWSQSFDDRMPIYRQIILRFNRAFVRGDIKPGDRIPSIRELSTLLRVNTNTIQRVYQEMERETIISSKRGTGYYLTEDSKMTEKIRRDLTSESVQRVYQEMERDGMISSKRGTGYYFTEDSKMTEKIRRDLTKESLHRFVEEMGALGLRKKEIIEELEIYMKGDDDDGTDS